MGDPKLWHGRIHRTDADEGYEQLQSIYHSDDRKKSTNPNSGMSKVDRQFESSKELYITSSRFRNAVNVLQDICTTLLDKDTSRTKRIEKTRFIGSTHFVPIEKADPDVEAERKTLPKATRQFYDMVG